MYHFTSNIFKILILKILFYLFPFPLFSQFILDHPKDTAVCENSTVLFSLKTDSSYIYGFQWQDSSDFSGWNNIQNETDSVLIMLTPSISIDGYKFRCILDTNGVGIDTTNSAILTIYPLPQITFNTVFPIVGECDTSLLVYGGLPSGGTYIANALADTIFNPSLAGPGMHTVSYEFTDSLGCTNVPATNYIQVNPLPQITFTTFFPLVGECDTSLLVYGGLPSGGTYIANALADTIFNPSLAGPGMHTVSYEFTDSLGCTNVPATNYIQVKASPTPIIIGPSVVCANEWDAIYETAQTVGNSYQWITQGEISTYGENTNQVVIHWDSIPGMGAVSVIETDYETGCQADTSYTVTITQNMAPNKAKIELKGEYLLICMDFEVDAYQWYYDGIAIPGEIYNFLISDPNASGDYWVITFKNGCKTESEHFNYLALGIIGDFFVQDTKVYPNPNNGNFVVEHKGSVDTKFTLFDMDGRKVNNGRVLKNIRTSSATLEFSSLHQGMYFLEINTANDKAIVVKVIIK